MIRLSINVKDARKTGYSVTRRVTPMYESDSCGEVYHTGNLVADVITIGHQEFTAYCDEWAEGGLRYDADLAARLEAQGIRTCAT